MEFVFATRILLGTLSSYKVIKSRCTEPLSYYTTEDRVSILIVSIGLMILGTN